MVGVNEAAALNDQDRSSKQSAQSDDRQVKTEISKSISCGSTELQKVIETQASACTFVCAGEQEEERIAEKACGNSQDAAKEPKDERKNRTDAIPAGGCEQRPKALKFVSGGISSRGLQRKQKKKREFIYGNYNGYYGYRIDRTSREDPRFKFFRKEWFQGKNCLDIGCNEGFITILVAQKLSCESILGLDIDPHLIQKARYNLRKKVEQMEDTRFRANMRMTQFAEQSNKQGCEVDDEGEEVTVKNEKGEEGIRIETDDQDVVTPEELQERVQFRTQNYIETYVKRATYDTVICLSVTKWIQLNWGDEGLINLFSKIWEELRPGGLLVLEPQPWSSYEKKRRVSKVATKHFHESVIRPDDFPNILTEKIGFKSWEEISSSVPDSAAGFSRPLFLYYK